MKIVLTRLIPLCILLITTTSCFEVIEELTVHNNGSGHISITLNASQSKNKLASVMLLDSVQGHKVPSKSDVAAYVKELANKLKASEGISNVTHTIDLDSYIVTLECDFKKVDNLNSFAQQLWNKQKITGTFRSYVFDPAALVFNRKFNFGNKIKEGFNDMEKEDKKVLNQASFTTIYRFDTTIASYSNKAATLSKSKKALMAKLQIMDIINGKSTLENNIQLTK